MKKAIPLLTILLFIISSCFPALAQISLSPNASSFPGIPVLIYHEIVSDSSKKPGNEVIALDRFEKEMRFLKEKGYHDLSFKEFVQILQGKKSAPDKAVVITIDDGFKNALQAVPILQRYNLKASFWIIAGDKGIGGQYMDWKDIEALDHNPLVEVESHSFSHPCDMVSWINGLTEGKGESDIRFELQESKRLLEQHLGHPIRYFAWPCGRYNERIIQLAREAGYEALLTAWNGLNVPGQDVMQIHRTIVSGSNNLEVFSAQLKDGLHRP